MTFKHGKLAYWWAIAAMIMFVVCGICLNLTL